MKMLLCRFLVVFVCLLVSTSLYASTKRIGILVFDGFLTSDVTAPVEVFGAASKQSWFSSYEVVVVSATKNNIVESEEGLAIIADTTIYDKQALDVLLVPSAYDMDAFINDKNLIKFIRNQSESASWVSSNCSGAFLLAEAGVLDGKQATTWAGGEKDLQKSYPKVNVVFHQNVVIDDKIVTSNGGPISYQAAFELLALMSSDKFAQEISETIQFNRLASAFGSGG